MEDISKTQLLLETACAVLSCCSSPSKPDAGLNSSHLCKFQSMPYPRNAINHPNKKHTHAILSYIRSVSKIIDDSRMASQDRYSSAYVRNLQVLISVEADDPCPCLLYCRIPLLQSHGSSRTNRDPLYFCHRIHWSHIRSHSHSSAK